MTLPMFDLASHVRDGAALDADATLAIRRSVWPDGRIDPAEAEAIFDLNASVGATSREWVDFFVEALTDYIVAQQVPTGYVDDAKATWMMGKIDRDGRVGSLGELELLVKVLERATNVPDSLKAYALAQIEAVVLTGVGPTRDGGKLVLGSIEASEVALLRRILFAQASDGPATISRAEAEMLFRIKDATLGAVNAPEWKTLFVQAIGNHLMVTTNYQPIDRARAAQLEAVMSDTRVDTRRFLSRMANSRLGEGLTALRTMRPAATIDAFADDEVDGVESAWLDASIDGDGQRDPLEEAVLAFIAQERATQ